MIKTFVLLALIGFSANSNLIAQQPVNTFAALAAENQLIEVASSPQYQWNGIALTSNNRMFASFPRLIDDETISVAEILKDGSIRPLPGGNWNTWSPVKSSDNPGDRFINVNAVYTDKANNLWVVDAASLKGKVVPGGPKLVKINLTTNRVERVYRFNDIVLPPGSSLNDVRIGTRHAYLTESGKGAIIVVDLQSGAARRLLDKHPSTKADPQLVAVVEGRKVLNEKGEPPKLNANNIELTPDEQFLLYKTTFGFTWYRVPTAALLDPALTEEQVGARVEQGNEAMPTGGSTMDDAGNIYLMDMERRAIWQQKPDGTLRLVVRDPRLLWHDASDISSDGFLYVPVAQNHRIPIYNRGINDVQKPYRLYKIKINN